MKSGFGLIRGIGKSTSDGKSINESSSESSNEEKTKSGGKDNHKVHKVLGILISADEHILQRSCQKTWMDQ